MDMNIWGITGIIAAFLALAGIFFMIYKNETVKQRQKDKLCAYLGHDLDGCVCKRCGKEAHDWDVCICRRCGKTRESGEHEWMGCVCKKCGTRRDEQHIWIKSDVNDGLVSVCKICGRLKEDNDKCDHEWEKTNIKGVSMICRKCGKEKEE